jgi:hypothetical protein
MRRLRGLRRDLTACIFVFQSWRRRQQFPPKQSNILHGIKTNNLGTMDYVKDVWLSYCLFCVVLIALNFCYIFQWLYLRNRLTLWWKILYTMKDWSIQNFSQTRCHIINMEKLWNERWEPLLLRRHLMWHFATERQLFCFNVCALFGCTNEFCTVWIVSRKCLIQTRY